MIAYSHFSDDTRTDREARKARLKTQAALYINGYQRDWYGFNKGAVIGSFDGVLLVRHRRRSPSEQIPINSFSQ